MGWLAGTMKDGEVDWLASRSAWSFPSPRQQSQPNRKGNTGSPARAEVGHQRASGPDEEQAQLSSQLDGNNPGAALCFYFNKPYHLPSPCGLPECFPGDPMKRPISTSNTTLIFSSSSLRYILAYVMINKAISGIYLPPYCQFHLIKT